MGAKSDKQLEEQQVKKEKENMGTRAALLVSPQLALRPSVPSRPLKPLSPWEKQRDKR